MWLQQRCMHTPAIQFHQGMSILSCTLLWKVWVTLSTPESGDLSAHTPVWSQGNKIQLHLLASGYVQLGRNCFSHPQKFVTCNFVPILNWSKAEPEAFFFELKTERKTLRAFLLLEIRELVWLTGDLASNTLLHGPHWGLECASSLFAPHLPSSLDAGLLTKW